MPKYAFGGWLVVLFSAASYIVVRSVEQHELYLPDRDVISTPRDAHLPYEEVLFTTHDGRKLHGWWVPANQKTAPVLLVCHGQGGNIGDRLNKIKLWHRLGLSTFIFDYRGYGDSVGDPSEVGLYADGDAAFDWVNRRVRETPIYIYGTSLGGGVATEIALRHPAAGLILEDTFTSIEDMAKFRFLRLPLGWLISNRFENRSKIARITIPVLIFHSKTDEVVPFEMGLALYEAANMPKTFIRLYGPHDGAYSISSSEYNKSLLRFVGSHPTDLIVNSSLSS